MLILLIHLVHQHSHDTNRQRCGERKRQRERAARSEETRSSRAITGCDKNIIHNHIINIREKDRNQEKETKNILYNSNTFGACTPYNNSQVRYLQEVTIKIVNIVIIIICFIYLVYYDNKNSKHLF